MGRVFFRPNRLNENNQPNNVKMWMVTTFEILREMMDVNDHRSLQRLVNKISDQLEKEYSLYFDVLLDSEGLEIIDTDTDGFIYCTYDDIKIDGTFNTAFSHDILYFKKLFESFKNEKWSTFANKLYSMVNYDNSDYKLKHDRVLKLIEDFTYEIRELAEDDMVEFELQHAIIDILKKYDLAKEVDKTNHFLSGR